MRTIKTMFVGSKSLSKRSFFILGLFASLAASAKVELAMLPQPSINDEQAKVLIDNSKPVAATQRGKSTITIYKVADYTSEVKDEDEYAKILAPELYKLTEVSGYEVCASFCRAENGNLAATITTVKSSAACPITTACPKGFKSIDVDIHSHPHTKNYKPSDIDKAFLSGTYSDRAQVSTLPELFSDDDRQANSGYLVTPTKLKHVKKGKIKELAKF